MYILYYIFYTCLPTEYKDTVIYSGMYIVYLYLGQRYIYLHITFVCIPWFLLRESAETRWNNIYSFMIYTSGISRSKSYCMLYMSWSFHGDRTQKYSRQTATSDDLYTPTFRKPSPSSHCPDDRDGVGLRNVGVYISFDAAVYSRKLIHTDGQTRS